MQSLELLSAMDPLAVEQTMRRSITEADTAPESGGDAITLWELAGKNGADVPPADQLTPADTGAFPLTGRALRACVHGATGSCG